MEKLQLNAMSLSSTHKNKISVIIGDLIACSIHSGNTHEKEAIALQIATKCITQDCQSVTTQTT